MKARLRKEKDIYFFDLEGSLDFQGVDSLKLLCSHKELNKKKIVFNLKALFFVGSTGLAIFSETLDSVRKKNYLKICCASSEFEKVLTHEGLDSVLFDSETQAVSSFSPIEPEKDALSFNQNEWLLRHEK